MNIAFVSTYDARDIKNWSGLGYYISKSLEDNNNNLQFIGSLRRNITVENFLKKVYYSKLRRKQFLLDRTVAMSKGYALDVARKLATMKADCVFSPGSIPVAYLKTDLPKIIFTDATFACLLNYYEPSSGLSADLIRQGHEIEKECLESCALAVYSSEWAAQSAIQFYGISPSKIKVVAFGANISEESSETEVNDYVLKKDNQVLKILFNGVNFIRKGGELVLATLTEIEKRGIKVELHMVGIPLLPIDDVPGFVINHGFLNKAVPEERELLINLYKTCHFLFLPSKAEAFGCVFCEASSFGMPSISRKTGGVSSAINDGINGFVLNASAGVNEYADLICHYFLDKKKFIDLSLSSFQEYQRRLNWKSAGASLTRLIKQL